MRHGKKSAVTVRKINIKNWLELAFSSQFNSRAKSDSASTSQESVSVSEAHSRLDSSSDDKSEPKSDANIVHKLIQFLTRKPAEENLQTSAKQTTVKTIEAGKSGLQESLKPSALKTRIKPEDVQIILDFVGCTDEQIKKFAHLIAIALKAKKYQYQIKNVTSQQMSAIAQQIAERTKVLGDANFGKKVQPKRTKPIIPTHEQLTNLNQRLTRSNDRSVIRFQDSEQKYGSPARAQDRKYFKSMRDIDTREVGSPVLPEKYKVRSILHQSEPTSVATQYLSSLESRGLIVYKQGSDEYVLAADKELKKHIYGFNVSSKVLSNVDLVLSILARFTRNKGEIIDAHFNGLNAEKKMIIAGDDKKDMDHLLAICNALYDKFVEMDKKSTIIKFDFDIQLLENNAKELQMIQSLLDGKENQTIDCKISEIDEAMSKLTTCYRINDEQKKLFSTIQKKLVEIYQAIFPERKKTITNSDDAQKARIAVYTVELQRRAGAHKPNKPRS